MTQQPLIAAYLALLALAAIGGALIQALTHPIGR